MRFPYFHSSLQWSPDLLAICLQKCLKGKALRQGKQVHALLLTTRIDSNLLSLNAKLVGMYASCGDLKSARIQFGKIQSPNVFAFNWMVSASAFNGYYGEAIEYFRTMQETGIVGNKFTFPIILKACVGLMDLNKGKEVHVMVNKLGFGNDVIMRNGLMDMYCKCGRLCYARKVFDKISERDVASWTTMICGFCNVGKLEEAKYLFARMNVEGFKPNEYTWNAMIMGYARSGDSDGALDFFHRMITEGFVPDLATWNALISGFSCTQKSEKALKLFQDMLVSKTKPDEVTITALLNMCGSKGWIQIGRKIHGMIYRAGLEVNEFVCSALINMYSKCGNVRYAWNVFHGVRVKNIASWNAMIGCFGKNGIVDSSIDLFEKMQEEGVKPNEVTISCVLSACSHNGLVEKGLKIFKSIKQSYAFDVSKEHYACVVDLLCRSGRMIEAYEFIKEIQVNVPESIIGSFLNGCKIHGRKDLAKSMAEDVLRMDLKKPGGFVTLANIYAGVGEWEEVEYVRRVMKEKIVLKKPGCSWV